jgi:hypothetical protein
VMLAAALLLCLAQPQDPAHALVHVERLWDRAEHQAFTDLVEYDGRLVVTFREGSDHASGRDGVVRLLVSDDEGLSWRSAGLLEEEGIDLRDPKLSVTPDGRLMVVMGGSTYEGSALTGRLPRVAFGRGTPLTLGEVQVARIDPKVSGDQDWLWRVTWHEGRGFGVVYQPDRSPWGMHLVTTTDGVGYEHVATLGLDGDGNETTLRFREDGTMIALVRRESGDQVAMIGHAPPPYTEWTWSKLPVRLGGPNFAILPGGELLAAGREYAADGQYTRLGRVDLAGAWHTLLRLPSGGDTSYPGLLVDGERLWCSYYSGHEGRTSIYLAQLRLPNLLARE